MRTGLIMFLRWWSRKAASWYQGPGKEAFMAKLIRFYVPANFQPSRKRWTPPEQRGKIIEFRIAATRKSA
jgi:hypothetical protein